MWVLLKDFLQVSMGMGIGVVLMCMILCQEKVQIKNDFFPSCQHT